MPTRVTIVENPLAKYYLSLLRNKNTRPPQFRDAMEKLGEILAYEASRRLEWISRDIETPLSKTMGLYPSGNIIVVGILGASIPMLNGITRMLPWAGIGLIAARRLETRGGVEPVVYYERLPASMEKYSLTLLVDPMLATGKTIEAAVKHLRRRGAGRILILTIIASKPGLNYILENLRDVDVYTISIDPILNEDYMIVPGLGDAGDRALNVDLVF
jgi:uracil phosphoribosyltransferase